MGKSMEMAIGTYSWMSFCKRRVLGFILFSTRYCTIHGTTNWAAKPWPLLAKSPSVLALAETFHGERS